MALKVKDAFECINFELCYLLNESLRLGEYPISWGYSYVTPIPKEGDRLDPNNWRPISQMPIIGRLIEKAIHTQLKYYLDCKGILHKNQHGFRAKKSTGSAIFNYMNKLFSAYDKDESTVSVYIDYKKAFDTISHPILLRKLKLYGLSKMTLTWFEQYLGHRTQCTVVNGHKSDKLPISYGVPQGSTLGPKLFILYVNDLFAYPGMEEVSTLMYADDTVLYQSRDDPTDAVKDVQTAMNNIQTWCRMNKLTINENKTKFTTFLRKPSDRKYQIVSNNISLERTTPYKYLGADINNVLTMDSFNKNVCKKVNYKLYMFGKIRKYITINAAILIYKQTILPYFDYGSFLMNSASQNSISKLDKYQNRALRLIEYKPKHQRAEYMVNLMTEYRIPSIRQRRGEQLLAFMYSISRNPEYTDKRRPLMTLRSSAKIKFKEKLTIKTLVQKSPYNRGVLLWNTLTEEQHHINTLKLFKKAIKNVNLR